MIHLKDKPKEPTPEMRAEFAELRRALGISTSTSGLVASAMYFATGCHCGIGQLRKFTFDPYIVHPMRVALLVRNAGLSTEAVAGAVLHDAVEDTLVLLQLIGDLFGGRVRDIVFGTSAISRPEDGNRRTRKEIDRKHYASGDYEVQTIKIADFVDNAPSMISGNPEFASVWMEEKRMMLESFTSYEPTLMEQAASILADFDRSRESSSRPVLS